MSATSRGSDRLLHGTVSDVPIDLGNPFLENHSGSPFWELFDRSCEPYDAVGLSPLAHMGQLEVLDILESTGNSGVAWEKRSSVLSFDEVQENPQMMCKIRIIFFEPAQQYNTEHLAKLSHTLGIPLAFWDDEGNGSVSMRKSKTALLGSTKDICIRMMLKGSRGDAESFGFEGASLLLKQNDNDNRDNSSIPFQTKAFLCLRTPLPFRRRMYAAFDTSRTGSSDYISEVVLDSFRLVTVVLMSWYWWNAQLFWALRDNMLALEVFNSKHEDATVTTEFGYMHLLAKDMIQAIELMEFAISCVAKVVGAHSIFSTGHLDQTRLDITNETKAALDYQMLRFEGVLCRTQALLKRMDNQISLTFNLVQQHDAKNSQRSSDSVTTISFLTLLFLPGTAIATIFATPFFKPLETGFKLHILPSIVYYWALTIPVTVLIVSFWYSWRRRESKITGPLGVTNFWHRWTSSIEKPKRKRRTTTPLDLEFRSRSPHFWQYEPKWPLQQDESHRSAWAV